jgi:signal peptidase I
MRDLEPTKSAAEKPAPEGARTGRGEPPRGAIAEWTLTIILLLFGTTTLLQAFVIPTGSMEDTLLIGDHLLVDKLTYAPADSFAGRLLPYTELHRGDIIVFRYPVEIQNTFVKRVIGLPGDRIHLVDKQLYRNGRKIDEPYVYHKRPEIDPYRDNFPAPADFQVLPRGREMLATSVVDGEVVVPPNSYFAMGDNRDLSLDSRYWGFVPRENIVGKPVLIYWSYDATTQALVGPTISVDHFEDLIEHFFTKTRWRRTLKLVRGYPAN